MNIIRLLVDNRAPEWLLFALVAVASVYLTFNFAVGMGEVFVAALLAAEGSKYVVRQRLQGAVDDRAVMPALGWLVSSVLMVGLSLAASSAGMVEFSSVKDNQAAERAVVEKQERVINGQIVGIDNQLKPLLETIAVYNRADKATVGSAPLLPKVEKLEAEKQALLESLAALPVIPAPEQNALGHTVAKIAELTNSTVSHASWWISMVVAVLIEFLCFILFPDSARKPAVKHEVKSEPNPTEPTLPALNAVMGAVESAKKPAVLVAKKAHPEQLVLDDSEPVALPKPEYQKLTEDIKEGKVKLAKAEIRKAAKIGTRHLPDLIARLVSDGVVAQKGSRLVLI